MSAKRAPFQFSSATSCRETTADLFAVRSRSKEIFAIGANGELRYLGRALTTDREIVEGLRRFLRRTGFQGVDEMEREIRDEVRREILEQGPEAFLRDAILDPPGPEKKRRKRR